MTQKSSETKSVNNTMLHDANMQIATEHYIKHLEFSMTKAIKNIIEFMNNPREKSLVTCSSGSSLSQISPADKSKAEYLLKVMKSSEMTMRLALYAFKKYRCWELLDYKSFKEFVVQEFGTEHYQSFRRYCINAEIVAEVAGENAIPNGYKDSAIAPLCALNKKQRKKIWKALAKKSGKNQVSAKWLTAKLVTSTIEELYPSISKKEDCPLSLSENHRSNLEFMNLIAKLDPKDKSYRVDTVKVIISHFGTEFECKLLAYLLKRKKEQKSEV